jgi:protein TonB
MIAYAAQIASITLLAELLLRIVPVASAGFRYAYWRLALAAALLMPWLLRLAAPAAPGIAGAPAAAPPVVRVIDASAIAETLSRPDTSWLTLLPWIYAGGVVARLLWVGAGVLRLRALRRAGAPLADPQYDELQRQLGTSAELRALPRIGQPVTFGVRRPVVLLPARLAAASAATRRAVLAHELLHVRRRDWLWVMGEEALRATLWVHPAIWWLTARIRLTREEFTDHLAVLASGSRRHYMEALLAFAETARLEPAPAFARRAHLFHRIVLLSKEAVMSSRRIVLSGALIAVLFTTGAWYTSEAFPLPRRAEPTAALQSSPGAQTLPSRVYPITPENPIPRRVVGTPIPYPATLAGTGFEAAVEMHVTLNPSGSVASVRAATGAVSEARRAGAPDGTAAIGMFQAAVADAIGQWHYDPPVQGPIAFYVGVTFQPDAAGIVSQSATGQGVSAGPFGARLGTAERVSRELRATQEALRQVREVTRQNEASRPVTPAAPPGARAPLRIGGAVRAPVKTKHVAPVYPPIARSARVQGVVILEATIDERGQVTDARVLRSIPLLDQAAIDAVRQWEFAPTLLNGQPVAVIMTLTVQFTPEQ